MKILIEKNEDESVAIRELESADTNEIISAYATAIAMKCVHEFDVEWKAKELLDLAHTYSAMIIRYHFKEDRE